MTVRKDNSGGISHPQSLDRSHGLPPSDPSIDGEQISKSGVTSAKQQHNQRFNGRKQSHTVPAWSSEEDLMLVNCVRQGWSWKDIERKQLHKRSDNACRKRYKRLQDSGELHHLQDQIETNTEAQTPPPPSSSSLTSLTSPGPPVPPLNDDIATDTGRSDQSLSNHAEREEVASAQASKESYNNEIFDEENNVESPPSEFDSEAATPRARLHRLVLEMSRRRMDIERMQELENKTKEHILQLQQKEERITSRLTELGDVQEEAQRLACSLIHDIAGRGHTTHLDE